MSRRRKKHTTVDNEEMFDMLIFFLYQGGHRVSIKTGFNNKKYYGVIKKIDLRRHLWIQTKKNQPLKYVFVPDIIRMSSRVLDDIYESSIFKLIRTT